MRREVRHKECTHSAVWFHSNPARAPVCSSDIGSASACLLWILTFDFLFQDVFPGSKSFCRALCSYASFKKGTVMSTTRRETVPTKHVQNWIDLANVSVFSSFPLCSLWQIFLWVTMITAHADNRSATPAQAGRTRRHCAK